MYIPQLAIKESRLKSQLNSYLVMAEGDVHGALGPLPLHGHVLQGLQDSEHRVLVIDSTAAVHPLLAHEGGLDYLPNISKELDFL